VFYLIPQMVGAGVLIKPLLGMPHWAGVLLVGAVVILIVATAALFMLAIERRQKYKIELKSLLLGRWEKQAKADKEAKQAKKDAEDKKKADEKKTTDDKKKVDDTAATLRKILKEELDKLNLSVKPIVVEVHTHPAEKKDEDEDNLAGSSA